MHLTGCSLRVRLGSVLVFTVLSAALGATVQAQSPLGELAKKEAERRKSAPPATKVYTDKDLPPSAQKPPAPPAADPSQPAGPVTGTPADQPSQQKQKGERRDEAWWSERMARAREELRRNEIAAESLQSRINALTREHALPLAPARRHAVGQQRTEALNELARVKEDIARGRQQIADIEEEARKAGVPPGWLR